MLEKQKYMKLKQDNEFHKFNITFKTRDLACCYIYINTYKVEYNNKSMLTSIKTKLLIDFQKFIRYFINMCMQNDR